MTGVASSWKAWVRLATSIAVFVACASARASSPAPEAAPPVARDFNVVVLPGGFRVEGVYLAETRHVLELIQATKPKSVVIKVCRLTPERVVAQFQSSLYEIHQGGQSVLGMPRNALECAFPTERERSVKGS